MGCVRLGTTCLWVVCVSVGSCGVRRRQVLSGGCGWIVCVGVEWCGGR